MHLGLTNLLLKMRKFQYDDRELAPKNVLILAIIRNLYSGLRYEFYVNPWALYTADYWSLHGLFPFEVRFNTSTQGPMPGHDHANLGSQNNRALAAYERSNPLVVGNSYIRLPSASSCAPTHTSHRAGLSAQPLQAGSTIVGMSKLGRFHKLRYERLPEGNIRLLQLLPGLEHEPLRGVVYHVPMECPGFYRALSYVWGNISRTERLWTPAGVLSITQNLKLALQSLRSKHDPLTLWVDSVCIDQDDLSGSEKAMQIRLLPRIFQQAISVLAFLGNHSESQSAIETLMQIRAKGAVKTWPRGLPPVPTSWSARTVPTPSDPAWEVVMKFFENPWFRRAWVVQEVVLAASIRIICGKWVVDWNDLLSATETVDREYHSNVSGTSSRVYPWEFCLELARHREWEARQTRWALVNLLDSFRYLEATYTRDRFFALLGFASDGADQRFEPDYTSPLEVVIKRYAAVFIEQGKVLQLLYRAGLGSHPSRFPSWIPNWTVLKTPSIYEASLRGKRFCASWIDEPGAEHDSRTDELSIRGYRLSSVDEVATASNVPDEWYEYFAQIDTMVESLTIGNLRSQETHNDMMWKIPIAGVLYTKNAGDENVDLRASYNAFRFELFLAQIKKRKNQEGQGKSGPTWGNGLNYTIALQENVYGWKFFTTGGGLAGLAPPSTAARDLIYVFNGGGVPFVLRRSETRAGAYCLLGECYVYGLMNGEGAEMSLADEESIRLH